MRTNYGNRFTALLLAVMMLIGVMPTTVFAENTGAEQTNNTAMTLSFPRANVISDGEIPQIGVMSWPQYSDYISFYFAIGFPEDYTGERNWSVAVSEDWCVPAVSSGYGEASVLMYVMQNEGEGRDCIVSIYSGEKLLRQFRVVQGAAGGNLRFAEGFMSIDGTTGLENAQGFPTHNFASKQGETYASIRMVNASDFEQLTMTSSADWCHVSRDAEPTDYGDYASLGYQIQVDANETGADRTCLVTVSCPGYESRTIVVKQHVQPVVEFIAGYDSDSQGTFYHLSLYESASDNLGTVLGSDEIDKVAVEADWCSLDVDNYGDTIVRVEKNTYSTARHATVYCYLKDGIVLTDQISQSGKVPEWEYGYSNGVYYVAELLLPAEGGTCALPRAKISSSWTVNDTSDWVDIIIGNEDATYKSFYATVQANPTTSSRTDTVVVNYGERSRLYIKVTQDPGPVKETLSIDNRYLHFDADGQERSFAIISNEKWNITNNSAWCLVSDNAGTGNATVTVRCDTASSETRNALLTVTTESGKSIDVSVVQEGEPVEEPPVDEPVVGSLAAPIPTQSSMIVNRGETVTISWYASEGAERYGVWFYDTNPGIYVDAGPSLSVTHVFEHNTSHNAPFAVQIYALAGIGENQKQSEPATVLVTVGSADGKHDFTGATVYDRTLYKEIPGDHEFHLAYADVYKQTCIECGMGGFETTIERDAAQQEKVKHSYVDGVCQVEGFKHACVRQYVDKLENGKKIPVTNSGVWESQGEKGHVCTSIKYVTQCQYCLLESTRVEAYPYGNEVQPHLIHTEVLTYGYDLSEHWPVKVRETCGALGCNYSSVKEVSGKHEPHQMENGNCTVCGNGVQTGTFKYGGFINTREDSTATYYYSDSYFDADATGEANPHLATMSLCLELSAWTSFDTSRVWSAYEKTQNARNLLTEIGFEKFEYSAGWIYEPEMNSIGAVAAYKNIGDTTVIALAMRGGGYGSEWGGNFNIGASGNHEGFETARDDVLGFLKEYIADNKKEFKPTVKIWIVGFSRGGATANMVAGALLDKETKVGIVFEPENLFAYTFEAPMGYIGDNSGYPSIKNYVLSYDIVPLVAPSDWGFGRYNDYDELLLEGSLGTSRYDQLVLDFKIQYNKVIEGVPYNSKNQNPNYRISVYADKINVSVDTRAPLKLQNGTSGSGLITLPGFSVDFVQSNIPTDQMVADTVNTLFDNFPGLREGYAQNIEKGMTEFLAYFMRYRDPDEPGIDLEKAIKDGLFGNNFEGAASILSAYVAMPQGANVAMAADAFVECVCDGIAMQSEKEITDELKSALYQLGLAIFGSVADAPQDVISLIHYVVSTGMQCHWPEVSLAWLMSKDSFYTSSESSSIKDLHPEIWRAVNINCPVDVIVYDENGNEFASIRGETLKNTSDTHGVSITETGTKQVLLPADEAYSIRIVATGDGEMDYTVLEYNVRDREYNLVKSYQDLSLTTGDKYVGTIPAFEIADYYDAESDGSTTEYTLRGPNGKELQEDIELRGDDVYYSTVSLSTNNNKGIVTGGGRFVANSYAQVKAVCMPTVEFLGWYRNGQLVSNELIYRFEVKEDTALVAHFSEGEFYTLTVIGTEGGIVPEGSCEVPATAQIQLSAETTEGFTFVRWEATAGTISNPQSIETLFTMPASDVTITAVFDLTSTILPPDTGDHVPVELYWLLFSASACAMLICLTMIKRRTRKMV